MKLLDVLTAPWAILPDKLLEIQEIYTTHLRGEKIDLRAVEARLGRPLANEQRRYEIRDGVAILPIEGIIAKRANMFSQVSGGVSTELVGRDFKEALADPAVHSIILDIDSPGGSVDGTQTLASMIHGARGEKPVVAFTDGTMASAAYWIGSAAEKVVAGGDTVQVGSIGVVAKHVDVSGAETQRGVRTTEIVAGKQKRLASQYGPLSDEGRQSMQDQVDYLYGIFVDDIAKQRGVSSNQVYAEMADGRVFIGSQAIKAGLVDRVSTLDQLIAELNVRAGERAISATLEDEQGAKMELTLEKVVSEHPAIAEALRAEGAAAERQRIREIEAQCMPGHDALIAELKFDGKTSGPEAAQRVIAAEKAARDKRVADLRADAPTPLPFAPETAGNAGATAAEDNLPLDKRCAAQWDRDPDLRKEFSSLAAYVAFEQARVDGTAKIFRQ
jgi:capsid assembly protease